jgi:hypothetical protein
MANVDGSFSSLGDVSLPVLLNGGIVSIEEGSAVAPSEKDLGVKQPTINPVKAAASRVEAVRVRAGLSKADVAARGERAGELVQAGAKWYIIHPNAVGLIAWVRVHDR